MNREIKFRAWYITEKRMFEMYGFNENFVFEKTFDSPDLHKNIIEVKNCVLMQYTGFKDIYGKKIYEGDILEYVNVRDATQKISVEVYFDIEVGAWCTKKTFHQLSNLLLEQNDDDWKKLRNWNIKSNQYIRVVGNIYENPKL